jgi:hypothetical protein
MPYVVPRLQPRNQLDFTIFPRDEFHSRRLPEASSRLDSRICIGTPLARCE